MAFFVVGTQFTEYPRFRGRPADGNAGKPLGGGLGDMTFSIHIGLSPYIVRFGPLQLTWHSLLIALSVALAVYLVSRWARDAGLAEEVVPSVAWWAMGGGIIGARALYVVDNWGYYLAHPDEMIAVWNGGIAVYGAFAKPQSTMF